MGLTRIMRELLSADGGISHQDAHVLGAALFDGGLAELETGAVLAAFSLNPPGDEVLAGLRVALLERVFRLRAPGGAPRPVAIASYGGTREQPNLVPLVALRLARFGVPVLIHGALTGGGRTGTAQVLRELGVMPCAQHAQAQTALEDGRIAFVPTAVVAPGLARLVALRARVGGEGVLALLDQLLDPFGGEGVLLAAGEEADLPRLREQLVMAGDRALLLQGTEGEAFADPLQRPRIEFVESGVASMLFDAERGAVRGASALPPGSDVAATAAWTHAALAGQMPLPLPIVNQLACCLYASGYTHDLTQAKAIVAVETGSLAVA
jgi:anthranilate phosphoribosyltransferase